MTWLSTWPANGKPAYRAHTTETEAAAHAKWLIDSDTARVSTYFELPPEEHQP